MCVCVSISKSLANSREVWVRVLTSVGRYDLGGVGGEEEVELGGYHVGTLSKFLARNSSYR